MHVRRCGMVCLALAAAACLGGCSRAPESLAQTTWKLTSLTTPAGTEYDEMAYDAIIGETVYRFGTDGKMNCSVAGEEDDQTYTYTYADGELSISSEEMKCSGTVKRHEIKLQLGEQGQAVLTQQEIE